MPEEPYTILVADDDPELRKLLEFNLEASGYKVLLARDGNEAMEIMAEQRPDLVILDILMPGKDGLDVLLDMKADQRLWHVPIIILTAVRLEEAVSRCWQIGIDLYITKPFELEELLTHVRDLLKAEART